MIEDMETRGLVVSLMVGVSFLDRLEIQHRVQISIKRVVSQVIMAQANSLIIWRVNIDFRTIITEDQKVDQAGLDQDLDLNLDLNQDLSLDLGKELLIVIKSNLCRVRLA